MGKLLLSLALALGVAGCAGERREGPMPQPTREPPPGFEDVDTAERPDAGPAEAPARETEQRAKARRDAS